MTEGFTDWLQHSRVMVVAVDSAHGRLRIRGESCQPRPGPVSCRPFATPRSFQAPRA